jgi:hypothetical protein
MLCYALPHANLLFYGHNFSNESMFAESTANTNGKQPEKSLLAPSLVTGIIIKKLMSES